MEESLKQLLLKDLCARLPYGVKVLDKWQNTVLTLQGVNYIKETVIVGSKYTQILSESIEGHTFEKYPQKVFPYLRPMSSMTKEEKEEIAFIRDRDFQSVRKWIHDESIKETGNICPITCGEIDYCNKKHLDYRGLIEKGLALEAPEGMYIIKEK